MSSRGDSLCDTNENVRNNRSTVSCVLKLAFHSADTDTDTDMDFLADILARIVARMSACR